LIFKDRNGDWYTPENCLLRGTQREFLLDNGIISEKIITVNNLNSFTHLMLINALLDFNEERALSIDIIDFQ